MPANSRRRSVAVEPATRFRICAKSAIGSPPGPVPSVIDVPVRRTRCGGSTPALSVGSSSPPAYWTDAQLNRPDIRVVVHVRSGGTSRRRCDLHDQSSPCGGRSRQGPVVHDDPRIDTGPRATSCRVARRGRAGDDADVASRRHADARLRLPGGARRLSVAGLELVTWDDDVVSGHQHHTPRFRPSWSPELLLAERTTSAGRSRCAAPDPRHRPASGGPGAASPLGPAPARGLASERVGRVARVLSSVPERTAEPVRRRRSSGHRAGAPGPARASRPCRGRRRDVVRVRWERASVAAGHRDHPDPAQPADAVHLPAVPGPHRLPELRRDRDGQRRAEPAERRLVRGEPRDLDLEVVWWNPAVQLLPGQQRGGGAGRGDVLVFLNDDTEIVDPDWMTELVGWASAAGHRAGRAAAQRPGRLDPARRGHRRAGRLRRPPLRGDGAGVATACSGRPPGTATSPRSPARAARSRRTVLDRLGGIDERFQLCGSDVALGLEP